MLCTHPTRHTTTNDTSLDACLGIDEPEVAKALHPDVKNGEELDFDPLDVFATFKKRDYRVHMYVRIRNHVEHITTARQSF